MNSDSNSTKNEFTDLKLREAYLQISLRPEFVERIQTAVKSELDSSQSAVQNNVARPTANRLYRRLLNAFSSLASLWLIAILLDRSRTANVSELTPRGSAQQPDNQAIPIGRKNANSHDTQSVGSVDQSCLLAISGCNGYIAGKLYDDPQVEIYVVLPTQIANTHIE